MTSDPTGRLRPCDRRPSVPEVIAFATVAALCVGLFLLVAEDVLDGGGLISRDESVLDWFVGRRSDTAIAIARWISTFGGYLGLTVAALLLAAWLWRLRRTSPWLSLAPMVALNLGGLASTTAKSAFGRERPPVSLRATEVTLAAFPSGHATDAAAFFVSAALVLAIAVAVRGRTRVVLVAVGAFLAGTVGISRLVLGVHWLSDVVAGWALGTAVAIGVVLAAWTLAAPPRATDG